MWLPTISFIVFFIGLILRYCFHRNENLACPSESCVIADKSCTDKQKKPRLKDLDRHELWRIIVDVTTILSLIIGIIGLIITLRSNKKTVPTSIEPYYIMPSVVDSDTIVPSELPLSDSLKNQGGVDQGMFIMGSRYGDNDIVIVNLRYEGFYPVTVDVTVHEKDICTLYNKDDFPRRIYSYDNIVVKLKYRYPEILKTTISKINIDFALTSDFGSKYSEVEEVDVSEYIDINNNPKKP